ncbi:MAG: hypothetical protein HY557_03115 [Euryarchaeota archaeon]|nr:hypothetical protein [Euryarchaeota archaeon]
MVDALAASFREELRCSEREAASLGTWAKARVPRIAGTFEDDPEDILVRLRDPRVFGEFVEPLLRSRRLRAKTRVALADRAFDLLPIPRDGQAFLVGSRAPQRLLAIAEYLAARDAFNPLHLLHLVYAVFLDRSLVTNVSKGTRSAILATVARSAGSLERVCALYATMHLASVPPREAAADLRAILSSHGAPQSLRRLLATVVASEGRPPAWVELAKQEGLLSADASPDEPQVVAAVPRVHPRVATLARRWLEDAAGR